MALEFVFSRKEALNRRARSEARLLVAKGVVEKALAEEYKVSVTTINAVVRNIRRSEPDNEDSDEDYLPSSFPNEDWLLGLLRQVSTVRLTMKER